MFNKFVLPNLSGKQLSDCTDGLSLQTIPDDHPLRIVAGAMFGIEPKDTNIDMFTTIAILIAKEWNRRYKILKSWVNSEIPNLDIKEETDVRET